MIIANAKLQNGIFDIKIEDGKIKEIGKHEELLKLKGEYVEMIAILLNELNSINNETVFE